MNVADDLTDLAIRIQGLCNADQATRERPSIIRALGRARYRHWWLRPGWRRSSALDEAADWLHQSLMDAPIAEELKGRPRRSWPTSSGSSGRIRWAGSSRA